jgi:hypothetical protein
MTADAVSFRRYCVHSHKGADDEQMHEHHGMETHPGASFSARKEPKKAKRGPRLTPGLRPQHPRWGGRRGTPSSNMETKAATREGASNGAPGQQQTRAHQQARSHQQQKPQPKGHSRHEPSTQQRRAGESGQEASRTQESKHAKRRTAAGSKESSVAPGAPARQQLCHKTRDPSGQATN